MTAENVAAKVRRHERLLKMNGGGVTFSGGEVLMQPDFIIAIRRLLPNLHALIETSGFASPEIFERVASEMDMVIMDIKIVNPAMHKRYTGVDNSLILENLKRLIDMKKTFRIRIPLIPSINDTYENMEATAKLLENAESLEMVELLRYNKSAGAKYDSVGMIYKPDFPTDQESQIITEPFVRRGIRTGLL